MKKTLIFVSGIVIGALICILGFKLYVAPFHQWQTNTSLAVKVETQLLFKKNLDENKIDNLRSTLELLLKHDSEALIALYQFSGGKKDSYIEKVIENIKLSDIDLDKDRIDEIVRNLTNLKNNRATKE
jgi:hypothetical protein